MSTIDIAALRERLGTPGKPISQAELARRVGGISQSTVSRIESGEVDPDGPLMIVLRQLDAMSHSNEASAA